MTIYERWAEIKCPKCGYDGGTEKVDLSEYQFGKQGFSCPVCNYSGWSELIGIEYKKKRRNKNDL